VVVDAEEDLKISVEDDGIGFDPVAKRAATSGSGLGLFNMENRARLLNATMNFDTQIQTGTRITLIVPYEAAESLHRG
jgi:signal transduction histidine kinase